jgi:protein translocase SecG subunit
MELLSYAQIIFAVGLVASILMQQSEAGLGALFGGSDFGTFHHTRRGFEKILFNASITFSILFVVSILLSFVD